MIKLTQVNIIGQSYFHKFLMDDKTVEFIECSQEDYEALNKKNPINPTIENGEWKYSLSRRKLDTPSGYIENGQYFIDTESVVVGLPTGEISSIDIDQINDGIISDKIAEEIRNRFKSR